MVSTAAPSYTATARFLHWLTAAMILVIAPLGVLIANVDFGPRQDTLYHVHRSLGAILLLVMVVRLAYRLFNPPPPLPADIPPAQQTIAHLTHWLLYALVIAQSLVGWIATSAYRAPVMVFWLFELPPIWAEDRAFSERMFGVHALVGIALGIVITVHIGAALYHHFVRRDGVLLRMIRG